MSVTSDMRSRLATMPSLSGSAKNQDIGCAVELYRTKCTVVIGAPLEYIVPSLGLAFALTALTSRLIFLDLSVTTDVALTNEPAAVTTAAGLPEVIDDSVEDGELAVMPNLASRLRVADADSGSDADDADDAEDATSAPAPAVTAKPALPRNDSDRNRPSSSANSLVLI